MTSVNISDLAAWCNIYFGDGYANPLSYAHHLNLNGEEIRDLVIPNSVTSIGNLAFYECSNLTSVTIHNSVTSIGNAAFYDCTGLTSVTIPNSVRSIGGNTFYGCSSLTSLTIGNSVTSIGMKAFSGCKNIETVTCYAEKVPIMESDVFYDSYVDYATLKVPDASVDLYKDADQWKNFGSIIGIGGVEPEPDPEPCATPEITFADGKITATSETEGSTCHIDCSVSYSASGTDAIVISGLTLNVSAYATADGYTQSETATTTISVTPGMVGDVNTDGIIDIADVNAVLTKMFSQE